MKALVASVTAVVLTGAVTALAQSPTPRWRRPPGQTRYFFTSTEQAPDKTSTIALEVTVIVKEGAADLFTLDRGQISEGTGEPRPIHLSDACRHEFGGSETTLGRVELAEGADPAKLVPPCVPEGVFGAVTDVSMILLVQNKFFGTTALKAVGDSAPFPRFDTEWSRPDPEVHARVSAPGGATRLTALQPGRALVEWRPDPMEVVIARRVMPTMAVLMRGQERCAVEVAIDPRTGALLAGRSLEDRLDMQFWPVPGTELPPLTATPPGPSRPIVITRTLSMVPRG